MPIAFTKLPGLDSEKILALIEPVLLAHGVEGVELIWRSDHMGWLLLLTIERPDSTVTGAGITVDVCAEISRDLVAALDVADLIGPSYRLEVGSPGVERPLYHLGDYRRFAGQGAKLKLKEPLGAESFMAGQRVVRGQLLGVEGEGILLDTEKGNLSIELSQIESAHLLFSWKGSARSKGANTRPSGSGKGRGQKRSN